MLTSNAPNALDLLLPKAKGKSTSTQNVSVSINKKLEFFVDQALVDQTSIESTLQAKLQNKENPTIILRVEESVPIEKAVSVMEIANRNRYKIILAVRPN